MAQRDRSPHLFTIDWYEDITPQLKAAAGALPPGDVAREPGFLLYDALSAFQISNPKVDTGSPAEFHDLEDEFTDAKSQFAIKDAESCAAFLDALMGTEMAWQYGYSMLQTLLSCVAVEKELRYLSGLKINNSTSLPGHESAAVSEYLESIAPSTPEEIARIAVIALIRSVSMCIEIAEIIGGGVLFPEEDLHTNQYNLYFLDATPVQAVIEMLERAKKGANTVFGSRNEVLPRLELRISWLNVLKQRIPRKPIHLDRMIASLEGLEPLRRADGVNKWFSSGCQARVDMSNIHQPLERFDLPRAREMWLSILQGIKRFVPVYQITRSVDLLGFFLSFSSRREPVMVRAMAKSMVSESQILGLAAKTWVSRDINETLPAPGIDLRGKHTDTFLGFASMCYTDLLTLFCQNRSRLREGLATAVLSFDSLQVGAEKADEQTLALGHSTGLKTMSGDVLPLLELSSWTYFRKLQVMLWIVLLSFETDIIAYGEMASTYWYAHELSQQLLSQLGRMRSVFEQRGGNARESPGYAYLAALELESQMLAQLCMAEYMLWIAIHRIKPPNCLPNSMESRFRLRFVMFESVGVPQMPSHSSFEELAKALSMEVALAGAANAAKSVQTMLSTLGKFATENPEIPLLKRSALGLSIAVTLLIRLGSKPIDVETERDNYHWYFPVPKITEHQRA